jgi:peptidoglycan/xylan/chitin deacetylase (PgdA/CDA1 family)
MIGVVVDPADEIVAREFFELFKTPWEIYRENEEYDVVLCSGTVIDKINAKTLVVYSSKLTPLERARNIQTHGSEDQSCFLVYQGDRIPIYGGSVIFTEVRDSFLRDERSGGAVAYKHQTDDQTLCRVGYDLVAEIRTLLTTGQPVANAGQPTVEFHIALLRDLIVDSGATLLEIPPVPDGYQFIVCLTHDVDHPSIRLHGWDHTALGFLYRAIVGSAQRFLRGKLSTSDLITNWIAALRLPFVQLGLAKDFWLEFADLYRNLEEGLPSTFFVIPFSRRPGKKGNATAPEFRAAAYGAQQIESTIRHLLAAGCEVGLHGIDAWTDRERGQAEIGEIQRLTGIQQCGTRMHWLYYDERSPEVLEDSGAAYDSTSGYNETVGYRAGTTQVFKPLGTRRMLELPLHVMDTALFYPTHQDYSSAEAEAAVKRLIDNASRFGGCLTINWHDRSVAPERLWDSFYRDLLSELKVRGAWFATAGQAVEWFRMRRAAKVRQPNIAIQPDQQIDGIEPLPGLQLRCHQKQVVNDRFAERIQSLGISVAAG